MPSKPAVYRPTTRRPPEARPSAAARGYTRSWRELREAVLSDVHGTTYPEGGPLCRDCLAEGRTTEATEVDHAIPHRGDPILFSDPNNLRSLCKPHHSRKTVLQDGGLGHPPTGA